MYVFFKQKTAYEMRISDWSSDVCSSDLTLTTFRIRFRMGKRSNNSISPTPTSMIISVKPMPTPSACGTVRRRPKLAPDAISIILFGPGVIEVANATDRKSVVEGKRVSVRVVLGGSRHIKKKKQQ